jgi:hypothetical protein
LPVDSPEEYAMQGYGDNFILVVPVEEGDMLHTATNPFCSDECCPCHEDPELVADVNALYQEGLVTLEEAVRIVRGISPR